MSPSLSDSSSMADSSERRTSKDLLEDLEMSILTERIRLLASQRQLAALRCQRFTEMLEASLASSLSCAGQQWPQGDVSSAGAHTEPRWSRKSQEQHQQHHHHKTHKRRRPTPKAFLSSHSKSVPAGFSTDQLYYG